MEDLHVGKATLGITTSKRSLTAFKTGNGLAITSSRLLTFVTSCTGTTSSRRWTTTETFALRVIESKCEEGEKVSKDALKAGT